MSSLGATLCLLALTAADPDGQRGGAPGAGATLPQAVAPPTAPGAGDDGPGRAAERLFEEGQRQYERGQYDAAIASFARAYELFPAPILIFDLAQAHRRRGDCGKAREEYRRFRDLAPEAKEIGLVDAQLRTLERTCPGTPPAAAPAVKAAGPIARLAEPRAIMVPEADPLRLAESRSSGHPSASRIRWLRPEWVRFYALTVGLLAGTSATLLTLHGRDTLARWRAEDERLAAGADSTSLEDWVGRQQRNDQLAHSFRRDQRIAVGLGVVSLVGLVGGTLLSFPRLLGPSSAASQ